MMLNPKVSCRRDQSCDITRVLADLCETPNAFIRDYHSLGFLVPLFVGFWFFDHAILSRLAGGSIALHKAVQSPYLALLKLFLNPTFIHSFPILLGQDPALPQLTVRVGEPPLVLSPAMAWACLQRHL